MTDSNTVLIIFLLLVITAIAVWFVLYAISTHYKNRYVALLQDIGHTLGDTNTQLEGLRRFALEAPADEDPPYGPMVADLNTRLNRTSEGYTSCMAQLESLEQAQPPVPARLWDRLLITVSQLKLWREFLAHAKALNEQLLTLQKQATGALQQADEIHKLPIGIAGRVRSVMGASDRALRVSQTLQAAGVSGEALNSVMSTVQTHRHTLTQLPDYFLQESDDLIMANATPASVRDAWIKLSNVEKPVYDSLRRAQGWQTTYDETRNMLTVLESELATAERVLKQLPASIDTTRHTAEFDELRANSGVIQTTWRAPEVHRLADLSNAATSQINAIQHWTVGVMSVHKTYQGLEQAVNNNDRLIERIEHTMDILAQPPCRVQWTTSAGELSHLQTLQASIGATTQPRDPARLVTDLDGALDLGLKAETLEAHVNDVRDSQRQLLALVESPEFKARDEWFHAVASQHIEAMVYSRDNWSDQDGVANLKADAIALVKREQDLHPLIANEPIPEDELEQWSMRLGTYVQERRGLQSRLDSITKKYGDMQRAEKTSLMTVARVQSALSNLDQAIEQNVRASAVLSAWNETMSLRDDGRRLADALNDRANGNVAEKATAVTQWEQECLDTVSTLLTAVKAEMDAVRLNLKSQVDALVEIAPLDTEPSMMTAQQLLNEAPARQIGSGVASGDIADFQGIDVVVDQVNSAHERYLHMVEALDDLEHRIVVQLEPRVTRLDAAHAQAVDTLKDLQALQRQIPYVKP
ncbi:MAG TPA: hypothetical protein VGK87_00905, partial [Anaerolineae bacterium]